MAHSNYRLWLTIVNGLGALAFCVAACSPLTQVLVNNGEEMERSVMRARYVGPYVLMFALDGVGYDQMLQALRTGDAPQLDELFGANQGGGIYQHAYSVPNAMSILPSVTIAAWSSIFTGTGPAENGVPGNEWFVREQMRFVAPDPVSAAETDDVRKAFGEDLVGKSLQVPTLFERVQGSVFVSLNYVQRGADLFTYDDTPLLAVLTTEYKAGKFLDSIPLLRKSYIELDLNSVPKAIDALRKYGVPALQVMYFPGIDLYTHIAEHPLADQVKYLHDCTLPMIVTVLDEYRRQGVLQDTYILLVFDHGHTPVLQDDAHALAQQPDARAPGVLAAQGFRVRAPDLEIPANQSDYQAVLAYQDGIGYVYLADRSTCVQPGSRCDWSKPPRFEQDVLPVANAFYRINQGDPRFPKFNGVLDLVFARMPAPLTRNAEEFQVYNGKGLVPIRNYLAKHPRPDLLQLDRRMRWLSAGPFGHRAGDVLLLAKSGLERPIGDRYYFSTLYRSQHGSASLQDSHITLMVARQNYSGETIRNKVVAVIGVEPSQLGITPLVLKLLSEP